MSHQMANDMADHKLYATESERDRNGNGTPLQQTFTVSPAMFEKMYLDSKREVSGDLRKKFANPTPLALTALCVGLMPLSIQLMGWRGSGGVAAATTTVSLVFGLCLWLAGILEFILGNTFSFVVFMSYGGHFLADGMAKIPWFNAENAYVVAGNPTQYNAGYGFYFLGLAMLSTIFLICSIRTNIGLVVLFLATAVGFALAAASNWMVADGRFGDAGTILIASGACFFVTSMIGWYLLAAILFAEMDLPSLPVFDLSMRVKGVSQRKAARHEE